MSAKWICIKRNLDLEIQRLGDDEQRLAVAIEAEIADNVGLKTDNNKMGTRKFVAAEP